YNQHGVHVAAVQREAPDLWRIDDVGNGGFERGLRSLGRFEGAGAAQIEVGSEERQQRFALGEQHAAVAALLPDVAERTKPEHEIDSRGYGQHELVDFLRLVFRGAHAHLVLSRRQQRQDEVSGAVAADGAERRDGNALAGNLRIRDRIAGLNVEDAAGD